MRIICILMFVFLSGCTSQPSVSNVQGEEALNDLLENIEYVLVDEDNFINDDRLNTIQIVTFSSMDNHISDDGQVAYVAGNNIENLDVELLLLKYVTYLLSLGR